DTDSIHHTSTPCLYTLSLHDALPIYVDKQFVYNRDGAYYHVEPYALIWQNDFYYLIGHFQKTNEMRHYRLDRIRNIKVSEESLRSEEHTSELQSRFDLVCRLLLAKKK